MRRLRNPVLCLIVLAVLAAMNLPARAQQQLKIGMGFGLAFLPLYICEDLKLVEKYGRLAHVDVRASFQRFDVAAKLQGAVASGSIDLGPFGVAPLLSAFEKAGDTPSQILAVSGLTSLPLALLSTDAAARSIADIKPADRIAVPTLSSPQAYLLELQSEKVFGQYDRLRKQMVVLSHGDAMTGLARGDGPVTSYFSSPPFTQMALRSGTVHRILDSSEVVGGKASFLILGGSRGFIEAQPEMPAIVEKAIDEAARIIRSDPRRAAQIYLSHEPSMTFNAATIEAVLREERDEFGSPVHAVQAIADFMGRHGELKNPPQSWKDIAAPALTGSPSS